MTPLVTVTLDGPVATLTLDDGRGNALSTRMLEALDAAVSQAERDARVIILEGRARLLCGGLDLPALVPLGRPALSVFLALFDRVHEHLLGCVRPIITVARGSAVAGGAILLCAGDHRLVGPDGKVGINEVALGLNFPTPALELVRCALGARGASEAAQSGTLYEGEERRRVGFATEIVPTEQLTARARELAARYTPHDPVALALVRRQLREPFLERTHRHGVRDREAFLDRWFDPMTHARLQVLVERLTKRPPTAG
jgi:enoyl-CoA hydratase